MKSASKLAAILFGANAFSFLISLVLPAFDLHWLPVSILALAIWIFLERPFYKNKMPGTIDSVLVAMFGFIFVLYALWYILAPMIQAEQINDGPCSPNSIEKRCYTFTATNCSTIWSHYEAECRDEIKKKVLSLSPSALTGPQTKHCIYKRLDSSFQSARRTTDDSMCKAHFKEVESPIY